MAATFSFNFIEMGQGDCCMVRCPDGRVVLVDCGRTANAYGDLRPFEAAKVGIRGKRYAGGQGDRVAALILTHPDADHHNRVLDLLYKTSLSEDVEVNGTAYKAGQKLGALTVGDIYISDAPKKGGPLARYRGAALNANVYGGFLGKPSVHEVTINSTKANVNERVTWTAGGNYADRTPSAIAGGRLEVLSGTTESTAWKVEIIAGNVPKGYDEALDSATPDNAKSLITLFTIGGSMALLCGDATFSTEKFLLARHGSVIGDVELVLVPHHGSSHGSSPPFVKKVNPFAAVVSAGFLEHSYRHPRRSVLQAWQTKVDARGGTLPAHHMDGWKVSTANRVREISGEWVYDPPVGGVSYNKSRTCVWMNEPGTDLWALYMGRRAGLSLWRQSITSHLTVTSQKTQQYQLTKDDLTYTG